jgi:ketosteroid isomerase-like protein
MTTLQGGGRQETFDVKAVLEAFFQALIDKDMDAWHDLWVDDAVNEFPFAPPNYPTRLEGKDAIREYMKDFPANIDVLGVPMMKVHQTLDPNVVIMESQIEGRAVATGGPYNMRYICVIEFRDGKISRYVDYWNPLEVASALGGMEEFLGAFNAETLRPR